MGSSGGRRGLSRFVRGEVVVVPFPFSTGMDYKRRPALIISPVPYRDTFDYFLCACSLTAEHGEHHLIEFNIDDFESNLEYSRQETSYIRPTTLFTIDGARVIKSLGKLSESKIDEVMAVVRGLVN